MKSLFPRHHSTLRSVPLPLHLCHRHSTCPDYLRLLSHLPHPFPTTHTFQVKARPPSSTYPSLNTFASFPTLPLLHHMQVKARPPSFAAFLSGSQHVDDGFVRFLAAQLRESLGFEGVPVRIFFR